MPAGKFNDLGDFCFRHFLGENAADTHTVTMDMEHDLDRVVPRLVEEPLQNMNDELHRSVVVVQDQDLVEARPLGFRASFRHHADVGAVALARPAVIVLVAHAQTAVPVPRPDNT